MKLEDLKRLAAARTKGEWPSDNIVCWEFEPYGWSGTGPHIKPEEDDDGGARGEEHAMKDAEFIAACANNIDALIAVVEAAEKVPRLYDLLKDKLMGESLTQRQMWDILQQSCNEFYLLKSSLAALEGDS